MKKFIIVGIFCFLATFIYGQIPGVIVPDFSSRARDIENEDIAIMTEMFIDSLSSSRIVNVIDRNVLERRLASIDFTSDDWTNNIKTTQLGAEINADYLVSGLLTQLGTSITFTITIRDIRTLNVIGNAVRNQYDLSNVWDNSTGIPGQLSDMAKNISNELRTEIANRQHIIQQRLAQEEAERRAQLARAEEEKALFGTWEGGGNSISNMQQYRVRPGSVSGPYFRNGMTALRITFNNNGTFSAIRMYRMDGEQLAENSYTRRVEFNLWEEENYQGTFTREGNNIRLTWTSSFYSIRTIDESRMRNNENNTSRSGNQSFTITYSRDSSGSITGLRLSGSGDFSTTYRR